MRRARNKVRLMFLTCRSLGTFFFSTSRCRDKFPSRLWNARSQNKIKNRNYPLVNMWIRTGRLSPKVETSRLAGPLYLVPLGDSVRVHPRQFPLYMAPWPPPTHHRLANPPSHPPRADQRHIRQVQLYQEPWAYLIQAVPALPEVVGEVLA
ncbi:hypothetical protein FPQ18DRAFT_145406 [Pyronema domesticum]|nr:hypothetical protein FPQ18DRAFT_145406 [Pyronema domesticum]